MTELVVCRNLVKTYQEDAAPVHVLNGVDFTLAQGEKVAILGSSGSGKSTLLHILGALDTPTSGEVLFDQQDIFAFNEQQQAKFRNQNLGFIYQFHHLLPEFSALENVAMPQLIARQSRTVALEKARDLLQKVGLSHRLEHRPAQLSGGERQRVAIARALVNDPRLVLADEPTGNLDQHTGGEIYALINELQKAIATSFIVVTHDTQLAGRLDRVLHMVDGQVSAAQDRP